MAVIVVNRNHYKNPSSELENYTYIGRPHPLSNPFKLNAAGDNRNEVIGRYGVEIMRPALVARDGVVWNCLYSLAEKVSKGATIHLGCSCKTRKPEDRVEDEDLLCHADAAKRAIEWIVEKHFPKNIEKPPLQPQEDCGEPGANIVVGARVAHLNPEVVDRSSIHGIYYCKKQNDGNRPRRLGLVVATADSNPWDCAPGTVQVLWDDVAGEYLSLHHPFRYEKIVVMTKNLPSLIPTRLLKVVLS